MGSQNLFATVLCLSHILILFLGGLINELFGLVGIIFYFPGLFIFPTSLLLDRRYALPVLFLSGLAYDHSFGIAFGFHGIGFCFLYFITVGLFHSGQKSAPIRPATFQIAGNLALATSWFVGLKLGIQSHGNWSFFRFAFDLLCSTILLIPLVHWYPVFCSCLLELLSTRSAPKIKSI
jgi:hypothetical protein